MGSTIRFGLLTWQGVPWPALVEEVRYLEALGIETVWLADHYAWVPVPTDPVLETWTTLAALAAQSAGAAGQPHQQRGRCGIPPCSPSRRQRWDRLSGGRLDLGLGAGYFERELEWLGIPVLTPGGRVDRLREAVEVIDRLLRDRHVSFQGTYYHLDDTPLVPPPVQQPRPPLIIAARARRPSRSWPRMRTRGCGREAARKAWNNRWRRSGSVTSFSTSAALQSDATAALGRSSARITPGGRKVKRPLHRAVRSRISLASTGTPGASGSLHLEIAGIFDQAVAAGTVLRRGAGSVWGRGDGSLSV